MNTSWHLSAQQQYINFQGKIYNSGVPVTNANATLEFTMPSIPTWNWTISPVNIINGLYSVSIQLPQDVFDSANYSREMVVRYNGNRIDTITLYAPVERDPTARRLIRDSVLWENIRNKPAVDTSVVDELQSLSKNGDSVKLSKGGGFVLLPKIPDTLRSTSINGIFTVLDTSKDIMLTIPQAGTVVAGVTNQVYWQSFKATANGKLRELKLTVGSASSITINFYAGIGNSTLAIASKTFSISSSATLQSLDISSLTGLPYMTVTNGEVYTFEIKPASGSSVSVLTDASNPYSFGISSISNTTDIPFDISIDNSTPPCLTFDNNCRVGIGTNTPTAQLEVKGRVKDQTGFLVPVGTVVSYAGRNIPLGWMLCDGRVVSRTTYSDLFDAIDTSWGSGTSPNTFRIPDMRGLFVRGVDTSNIVGSTNNDPEHASRLASNTGGNSGNQVGSKQIDDIKSHTHTIANQNIWQTNPASGLPSLIAYYHNGSSSISFITPTVNASGGLESRPKNVYVYFIIKY